MGPLKIDQERKDKFRARLRDALSALEDDTKPLTVSSLYTMVDEITTLDSRLSLLEKKLEADRRAAQYLIKTTAKSEAAASEARWTHEMADVRKLVDTWKAQLGTPTVAPRAPPPQPPLPATLTLPQSPTAPPAFVPRRPPARGFRRG